jgi:hypothetical protein
MMSDATSAHIAELAKRDAVCATSKAKHTAVAKVVAALGRRQQRRVR